MSVPAANEHGVSNGPFSSHRVGLQHGWVKTVIKANFCHETLHPSDFRERLKLARAPATRLFEKDMFATFQSGETNLREHIVGGRNNDGLEVGAHQVLPIRSDLRAGAT